MREEAGDLAAVGQASSDPIRLRSASAATFEVEPMMATFRPSCGGPMGDNR
jgi:hypothetical protein